jgi:D-glycero-alpha-D-manno-heptose-7-phosphate kinase
MRIIRVPLRCSLFGGGTDLPNYLINHDITIISFAITRYMYVVWNPRPTGGCRLSYSRVEELGTFSYAEHTLVKAVGTEYGLPEPGTLSIIADIPKGTGLGSSSALAVGLCKLAGACQRSESNLATTAFRLENSVSPEVGCQDHLPATFGGMKVYRVSREGVVRYSPVPKMVEAVINQYGLLLYTGESRDSSGVLKKWKDESTLDGIRKLAEEQARCLDIWTPQFLGSVLDETWQLKRSIGGVSDVELDRQYTVAMENGAYGGKLCGAGGGGCWFFIVNPRDRERVKEALGLQEIPFRIEQEGVKEWSVESL